MSLLNEALRKNKSENIEKINFDFPLQNTRRHKRKVLIFLILPALLISGFVFVWINTDNDSNESKMIKTQTLVSEDVQEKEKIIESVVSEPVIPEEVSKEKGGAFIIPAEKIADKLSINNPGPVSVPSTSKVNETQDHEEKTEKVPEVTKTETADDEENYYKKAVQLHKQGRLERAILMYNEVLSFNSEHYESLFNLASIYITMARYSDAYTILLKLFSNNPADSKTMLNLAITEIGLGKNGDALFHLKEIKEKDSELQFRVEFHKGIAFSRTGDLVEALECYKTAEMLNHANSSLLLNMAVLYDRLGNYSDAIGYYLKLINSDVSDLRDKDKFKQRIEILQNNISMFPVKNSS